MNFDVLLNLGIESKQATQALATLKKLSAELEKLKKIGADGIKIEAKSAEIDKVLDAYTEIVKQKNAGNKAEKDALPFGIKKLELSKLQLQKAKELTKQSEENRKADEKAAKEADKAADKAAQAAAKQAALDEKHRAALEEENRLLSGQVETIADLEKRQALLVKQRKNMKIVTAEDAQAFSNLTAEIKANQDRLNEFNEQIGRHQGSVGNYLKVWEGMPGPLGQASGAVSGFGDQLKALVSNPYAAIFAAIAAVVVTLGKAFMETAGGAKIMDTVLSYSRATWDVIRLKAKDLGDTLQNITWDKFAKGAKNLSTTLLDGFVYRLTAPFKNFFSILKSVFTWDFEGIGSKFKDLAVSVGDFFSQGMVSGAAKLAKNIAGVGGEIDALAKKQRDLITIQRNLTFATMGYNEAIAKQSAAVELLTEKVSADSLSQKENEQAAKDLLIQTEKLAAMKKGLADANVAAAQAEVDLGVRTGKSAESMQESYQKLSDARVAATEADNQYKIARFKNMEEIVKRQMDWADLDLDVFIDGYDNRKTIMERTAALETTTAAERQKILEDFRAQEEKNRSAAVATLQKFAKEKIDIDELSAISDERLLRKRITDLGITERMGLRLFELIRERRTWNQDLTELEINNAKLNSEAQKTAFDAKIEQFAKDQELEKAQFEAKKTTEQERMIFEAGQRLAADEARLAAAQEFGIKMSETEKAILDQQILNDKAALDSATGLTTGKIKLKDLEMKSVQSALDLAILAVGEESKVGKRLGQIKQALALKDAFLQAKGAVLKAWNSLPFPANLGAVATSLLGTAPLVASIAAIKFEKGGVIEGPSHASGGVPVLGGRAELEGGEAVINKKDTAANYDLLSAINSRHGRPFEGAKSGKFADGGILPAEDRAAASVQVQTVYQPVLLVDDVTDLQNSQNRVSAILRG